MNIFKKIQPKRSIKKNEENRSKQFIEEEILIEENSIESTITLLEEENKKLRQLNDLYLNTISKYKEIEKERSSFRTMSSFPQTFIFNSKTLRIENFINEILLNYFIKNEEIFNQPIEILGDDRICPGILILIKKFSNILQQTLIHDMKVFLISENNLWNFITSKYQKIDDVFDSLIFDLNKMFETSDEKWLGFVCYSLKTKETSMSLYYYGGTTFINLPLPSRPASVIYEYSSYNKIGNFELEQFSKVLQPKKVEELEIGHNFHDTTLGDVFIHPNYLQTGFFKSPNGEKEKQGWILTKEQYPTEDYLLGDTNQIQKLAKTIDVLGFRQNSIRVNVEVPLNSTLIRDIMINLYRPENREEILNENNFKLETEYSNGFKNLLLKKDIDGNFIYNPTMDDLFDDFIIRQGVEILYPNETNIWSLPIEILRKRFIENLNYKYPSFGLDISPMLLYYKPNDEISLKLSRFITPHQSVQFREFRGKLQISIKRSVGIVKATEYLGPFIADSAISQISFIELDVIKNIRNSIKAKQNVYFKYIVWNSETCPNVHEEEHQDLISWYEKKQKFILGHIETAIFGYAPLIIPGDSVVWHQRQEHRFNIIGRYNPSLINLNIAHLLENKWFEYKYWETYCPSFLPKSKLLFELLPKGVDRFNVPPEIVFSIANEHFPNGWILKGVWDYNGIEHIITQKSNMIEKFNKYKLSNFDDVYKIKKQNLIGCEPIEDLNAELKNHTHFIGFKIGTLLKDSAYTFIQELKDIQREYRIECLGGYCPIDAMMGDGGDDDESENMDKYYTKSIHSFFTKCINSLPESLKGIPLTADPAMLKDGSHVTLETNPGGNGWFIHNSEDIALEHNKVLKKYIEMNKIDSNESPILHTGMKLEDQILFISSLLKKWNVSLSVYAKKFDYLLPDRIIDSEQFLTVIKKERLNYSGPKILAPKFVSKQVKELSVKKAFNYILNNMDNLINSTDFINSIENFSIMKKSITSSTFSIIEEIIKKFKMKFESQIIENHLKKMRKFELLLPLNYKLNSKMITKLSTFIFSTIKEIKNYQILDIEHQELRITLHRFFDILLNQNLKNWNTILFKNFDILGISRFNMFVELLKNKNTKKEALEKINPILSKLTDIFDVLNSLDRTGFKFPGISTESVLKIWTPQIRKLYSFFNEKLMKDDDEIYQDSFMNLVDVVTRIIYTSSDYSLFKLLPGQFNEEIKFLKEATKLSSLIEEESDIEGEIINCLMLLDGESDKEISKIIQENQFSFVRKQFKGGYWKLDEKINMNSIRRAVDILIDHEYAIEGPKKFGKLVSYEDYKKRLNGDGLMLNDYDFYINKPKHPNYDEVKNIVQRTFRMYSLERFFED
eukprot:gene1158-10672_t